MAKIDKTRTPEEDCLELLLPRGDSYGYIRGISELSCEYRMDTISTTTFTLQKEIVWGHQIMTNPFWDRVRCDYLINLNGEKTYIIRGVEPQIEGEHAEKRVSAYSLEDELSDKKLYGLTSEVAGELTPRKLHNPAAANDAERGILDIVLSEQLDNTWSVGYIDPDVEARLRTYEADNITVYNFFQELQKSFRCLFRYNTELVNYRPKRTIDIFDATVYNVCPVCQSPDIFYEESTISCVHCGWTKQIYGRDTGLYITDKNYITRLKESADSSQICTRLYIKGKDNLDIIYANPTGQEYIDDFHYYRTSDYMSDELLAALDRYDALVAENKERWSQLLQRRRTLTEELSALNYGNEETDNLFEETETLISDARKAYDRWLLDPSDEEAKKEAEALLDQFEGYYSEFAGTLTEEQISDLSESYSYSQLKSCEEIYQKRIDVIIELGESNTLDLSLYQQILDNIRRVKSRKEELIAQKEAEIEAVNEEIAELSSLLSRDKNFTEEERQELNFYIREGEYTNADIGTASPTGSAQYLEDVETLYQDGLAAMTTMSEPPIVSEIDVIDFLQIAECQKDWERLKLGDIIHIRHPGSLREEFVMRLIAYKHDPFSYGLQLTFSSDDNLKLPDKSLADNLKEHDRTSATVAGGKDSWNHAEQNAVNTMIENGLDTAVSAVHSSDFQKIRIDQTGINVSSDLEARKGEELRVMNNLITMTTDGWQTAKTAISPWGIIADRLIGHMLAGENLTITATREDGKTLSFVVDASGVKLYNGSMTILSDGEGTNGVFLDPASNRGIGVNNGTENTQKTYEERLNSEEGIIFETYGADGSVKKKVFQITPQGDGYLDGELRLRQLYIRDKDVESLITENGETKIKGQVINPKGLKIASGSHSFEVDDSAVVTIKNGSITMDNSTNTLSLMASDPISLYNKRKSKTVMSLDSEGRLVLSDIVADGEIRGGSITSDTEIDVTTDLKVGETIYLRDNTTNGASISIFDGTSPTFVLKALGDRDFLITSNNGNQFEIRGDTTYVRGEGDLRLGSGNGNGVYINGQQAATMQNLSTLESSLKLWVSSNFAPIGSGGGE